MVAPEDVKSLNPEDDYAFETLQKIDDEKKHRKHGRAIKESGNQRKEAKIVKF